MSTHQTIMYWISITLGNDIFLVQFEISQGQVRNTWYQMAPCCSVRFWKMRKVQIWETLCDYLLILHLKNRGLQPFVFAYTGSEQGMWFSKYIRWEIFWSLGIIKDLWQSTQLFFGSVPGFWKFFNFLSDFPKVSLVLVWFSEVFGNMLAGNSFELFLAVILWQHYKLP